MKKTSKALLLALCAVLLVAASVMGTMAYLTSSDTVTNTFTVGKVAITLDEAKVDEMGTAVVDKDGNPVGRVTQNSYKLLPGHEYKKDPTVHVSADSEDCYLFVKVTNPLTGIEDSTATIASQMTAEGWAVVDATNGIYVYGTATAPTVVKKGENHVVFEKIKVKGDVTDLSTYNEMQITVVAYAVQKDGFEGKSASEILTAVPFPSANP